MYKLLTLLLISFFFACDSTSKSHQVTSKHNESTYNYEIDELPEDLEEISGITFITDSLIAAIEDEHGTVYFYDLIKKKIVEQFVFAENGDYEDLIAVKNNLYVVNSKGTIFEILDFRNGDRKVNIYTTPFNKKNDIESLTYDAKNNSLLLAVKERNLNSTNDEKTEKNIYSFSLSTKTFNPNPVFNIRFADIEEHYKGDKLIEASKKFLKAIGNENLNKVVRPSAIAFHPFSDDLYVLSSINKIVIVLSRDNKLKEIIPLKGDMFRQPEGLSFNSKGEMYISNEGDSKKSNLIKVTSSK